MGELKEKVEVGGVEDIETKVRAWRIHYRGNPAEEALLIKELIDMGYKQSEIAKVLKISQPQVSRRLSLLNLIPELFEMLRSGKLRPSTAYQLSRLPEDEQRRFLGKDRITLKEVKAKRREFAISREVLELLEEPLEIPSRVEPTSRVVRCPKCGHEFEVEVG